MRERWSWPGAVALVLAVFVGGGWCTALVLSATPRTDTISEQGAGLLETIGGVLAGGVVTYLGSQIGHRRVEPHELPDTPHQPLRDDQPPDPSPGPTGS